MSERIPKELWLAAGRAAWLMRHGWEPQSAIHRAADSFGVPIEEVARELGLRAGRAKASRSANASPPVSDVGQPGRSEPEGTE